MKSKSEKSISPASFLGGAVVVKASPLHSSKGQKKAHTLRQEMSRTVLVVRNNSKEEKEAPLQLLFSPTEEKSVFEKI